MADDLSPEGVATAVGRWLRGLLKAPPHPDDDLDDVAVAEVQQIEAELAREQQAKL